MNTCTLHHRETHRHRTTSYTQTVTNPHRKSFFYYTTIAPKFQVDVPSHRNFKLSQRSFIKPLTFSFVSYLPTQCEIHYNQIPVHFHPLEHMRICPDLYNVQIHMARLILFLKPLVSYSLLIPYLLGCTQSLTQHSDRTDV
jgi:hypothetical protein